MAIDERTRQRLFNKEMEPKIIRILEHFFDLLPPHDYYGLSYQIKEYKTFIDSLDDILENFIFFNKI